MRLSKLHIQNFRSIVDSGQIRIEAFQAFVGGNNAGKSSILRAVDVFLAAGAGGVKDCDFFSRDAPIIIKATFTDLSPAERAGRIKGYLIANELVLEKHLAIVEDKKSPGKTKIEAEFHGYQAEPSDWWLSLDKITEKDGAKPDWTKIAEEHGLLEWVTDAAGKVNKTSYKKGLESYLDENEVDYDEPELAETQTLGVPQNLLRYLPRFYLLPAVTDYTDEIDRRTKSTVFRQLMTDLADRILRTDKRYAEVEEALAKLRSLLNPLEGAGDDEAGGRLSTFDKIEGILTETIRELIPSVQGVRLEVEVEESPEMFSRGVAMRVDDGVMTDVVFKGHGLQRAVVFGLLQTWIQNVRGKLAEEEQAEPNLDQSRTIILGIEEPELYIHPQLQRVIFRVLEKFADYDTTGGQLMYTTHSPAFVSVWDYHRIGVTRKNTVAEGTKVHQCPQGVLDQPDAEKTFKLLNSFGLEQNEIFFAQKSVLVEGREDPVAIVAAARHMGLFQEFPEEIGHSIIVCHGKGEIPKFQKLLNAFGLPHTVLHELDGEPKTETKNRKIIEQLNPGGVVELPDKVETALGIGHFNDQQHAMEFCSDPANLTQVWKVKVKDIFT